MGKTWLALFSQTGSEILSLSRRLDKQPIILTNNMQSTWVNGIEPRHQASHAELMNIIRKQYASAADEIIITLHGYLRILPGDICSSFEIYNGHPAPIHLYPELKGKDKQEDLFTKKEQYPRYGCAIHRVVEELDAGEIIVKLDMPNDIISVDDAYAKSKILSLLSWEKFFEQYANRNIGSSISR